MQLAEEEQGSNSIDIIDDYELNLNNALDSGLQMNWDAEETAWDQPDIDEDIHSDSEDEIQEDTP